MDIYMYMYMFMFMFTCICIFDSKFSRVVDAQEGPRGYQILLFLLYIMYCTPFRSNIALAHVLCSTTIYCTRRWYTVHIVLYQNCLYV